MGKTTSNNVMLPWVLILCKCTLTCKWFCGRSTTSLAIGTTLYHQYLDILIIVDKNVETRIMEILNLKFTSKKHQDTIFYFDITLKGDPMTVKAYRKPISRNSLITATSCHPKHVAMAIFRGQFIRIRESCTSLKKYEVEAASWGGRFLAREYDI